jgi:hypothetical protein
METAMGGESQRSERRTEEGRKQSEPERSAPMLKPRLVAVMASVAVTMPERGRYPWLARVLRLKQEEENQ